MRTLLFSMLLACDVSGDGSSENGDTESQDPIWFEEGSYPCRNDQGACPLGSEAGTPILFQLFQTGSISNYEFTYVWKNQEGTWRTTTKSGECFIGEALTPDERAWEASCEGLEEVTVYSEGFRIEVTWEAQLNGGGASIITSAFESFY